MEYVYHNDDKHDVQVKASIHESGRVMIHKTDTKYDFTQTDVVEVVEYMSTIERGDLSIPTMKSKFITRGRAHVSTKKLDMLLRELIKTCSQCDKKFTPIQVNDYSYMKTIYAKLTTQ